MSSALPQCNTEISFPCAGNSPDVIAISVDVNCIYSYIDLEHEIFTSSKIFTSTGKQTNATSHEESTKLAVHGGNSHHHIKN